MFLCLLFISNSISFCSAFRAPSHYEVSSSLELRSEIVQCGLTFAIPPHGIVYDGLVLNCGNYLSYKSAIRSARKAAYDNTNILYLFMWSAYPLRSNHAHHVHVGIRLGSEPEYPFLKVTEELTRSSHPVLIVIQNCNFIRLLVFTVPGPCDRHEHIWRICDCVHISSLAETRIETMCCDPQNTNIIKVGGMLGNKSKSEFLTQTMCGARRDIQKL